MTTTDELVPPGPETPGPAAVPAGSLLPAGAGQHLTRRARRVRRQMARPARAGGRLGHRVGLGVVAACCAIVAVVALSGTSQAEVRARLAGYPKPPVDARDSRVLPPVEVPDVPGGYAFMATMPDGSPVTYDPCRPIHVVINPQGAPPAGDAAIGGALARLSEHTGLEFVIDGTTTDVPLAGRGNRTDRGWEPVLIGWGTERTNADLAGPTAGVGGSVAVQVGGPQTARYVTGQVLLDSDDIGRFETGRAGAATQAIVMHELAHVVGLDHVESRTELMNPTYYQRTDFGPGDRAGLARLGQGACHTDT